MLYDGYFLLCNYSVRGTLLPCGWRVWIVAVIQLQISRAYQRSWCLQCAAWCPVQRVQNVRQDIHNKWNEKLRLYIYLFLFVINAYNVITSIV